MRAKAAVKTGLGDFQVREVSVPEPDADQVLIRIKASGICGSDLRSWKVAKEEIAGKITGHEFAGEVVEVGSNVTNVDVGDRVGVEPLVGCGKCYWCRIGQYNLCPELSRLRSVFTGFAEYSTGPSSKFYKLPVNVSYDEATLLDCLSVGVHAIHRAKVRLGHTVAVLGDGPIGLATTAVAAAIKAKVYCIGHHDFRLNIAKTMGATEVINSKEEDPLKIVELTGGAGVDVVIETVGRNAPTIKQALRIVRRGGVVAIVGSFLEPQVIDVVSIRRQEKDLIGVSSYAYWDNVPEFSIALDLLARGVIDVKPLITHKFPLEKINEAFETAANRKKSKAIKVLVIP